MSVAQRKERIDLFGGSMLVGFSALLAVNQVMVKFVNAGMNPVFQAGLRSACAILPVVLYMLIRGRKINFGGGALLPGIVCGLLFAFEFTLLFLALDYTTVARTSILFYTMPVWVALAAHFSFRAKADSNARQRSRAGCRREWRLRCGATIILPATRHSSAI
ncbi:MAG: DMT family transporter [Nitratireductor sp.]